jgi:outer membrane protein TolC
VRRGTRFRQAWRHYYSARSRQGGKQQAKRLYVGGKMDFLALLDAQRTLASADDAVANSHARLATDQVAIFLALGGGWE